MKTMLGTDAKLSSRVSTSIASKVCMDRRGERRVGVG